MSRGSTEFVDLVFSAHDGNPVTWICGLGFDPRALHALEAVAKAGMQSLDVWVINLPPEPGDLRAKTGTDANQIRLKQLSTLDQLHTVTLPKVSDPRSIGSVLIRQLIKDASLATASHVVLDVSSLPTAFYFPILRGLLELEQMDNNMGIIQVVAAENPTIDDMIIAQGSESPSFIPGFRGAGGGEESDIRIWAPVIGENQEAQLRAIHQQISPAEICPVLPFPSKNPRRADDLITQHLEILFQAFLVEVRNLIYADETNPFDLYRTLMGLHVRYSKVFQPLGGAHLILSSHASKMLSLGVILAATEGDLSVIHAPATGYILANDVPPEVLAQTQLTALWLTGPPFRS